MASGRKKKGLVGMLLTDRDAHLMPRVLKCLDDALEPLTDQLGVVVDLIVSLRDEDSKARAQVVAHAPKRARSTRFLVCDYSAAWVDDHDDDILDAICMQRNLLLSCARYGAYGFLSFLDSDVYLKPDSLLKLYRASNNALSPVVVIPYQPRWSAHVAVGVRQPSEHAKLNKETALQFLINPQLLKSSDEDELIDVSISGLGCSMIRPRVFGVEFVVEMSTGGVRGEDIGFCEALRSMGISLKMIGGDYVDHEAGGTANPLFIPRLDDGSALITHVKISQLSYVETGTPMKWVVSAVTPADPADLMSDTLWVRNIQSVRDIGSLAWLNNDKDVGLECID